MKPECPVCFHHCRLDEGQMGLCHARGNKDGSIVCLNYGKATSLAMDPIEKKPLYHFYPGTWILSYGSYGCNLSCSFCQNYEISQADEAHSSTCYISPEDLTRRALDTVREGNIGVAFTYNEPLIAYEYIIDTSKLLKEHDLKTVVVTNGCFTEWTAEQILPYVDAIKIDLKCFTEEGYRSLGGDFETVKKFIKAAVASGKHVELVTLIVPGLNDNPEEIRELAQWVASLKKDIPLHLTRFFPAWKMSDSEPTDIDLIYRLSAIAKEYLTYVHEGNIW